MIIAHHDVTGLILAGGRGSRMGGVDKGLQPLAGRPLAAHVLDRLRPQVVRVMISANRNLDAYRSLDAAVWPDPIPDYPGPLAGMLAGLAHCETALLATVPCDAPKFPADLVARLLHGLTRGNADIAVACTREGGELIEQPVFCLMKKTLEGALASFLASGERKVRLFAQGQRHSRVVFDRAADFLNINTSAELERDPPSNT